MAKDDVQYIKELATFLERKYSARNERIQGTRDRRMMRHAPRIPEQYRATATDVRTPIVFDMARRAVAIMASAMPRPKIRPMDLTDQAQRHTSLGEEWLIEAYKRMGKEVIHLLWDSMACDGVAVCKVYMDRHAWAPRLREEGEDAETYLEATDEHHRRNFPFLWEQVNSLTYYPVEDGNEEVLEITNREDIPYLGRKYGLVPQNGKLVKGRLGSVVPNWSSVTSVKFTEYWDTKRYIRMVGDEVVERGKHNYGRPPYFAAKAVLLSTHDPNDEGISCVTPLVPLQDLLDSLYTMKSNNASLGAFAYPTETLVSEELAMESSTSPAAAVKFEPGVILQARPGYRLEFMMPPPVGADLNQMASLVKGMIDELTLAPVVFGRSEREMSNAAMVTQIAAAQSIFNTAAYMMAEMFNQVARFLLDRILDLDEEVPLWFSAEQGSPWKALGPKHIKNFWKVEHELDPVLPAARMQAALFMSSGYQAGHLPRRLVVEEGYGYHNPEEIMEERRLEELEMSVEVQAIIKQEALKPWAQPPIPTGTPANVPIGMGGPAAVTTPGIQSPLTPQGLPIMPAQTPEGQGIGRG